MRRRRVRDGFLRFALALGTILASTVPQVTSEVRIRIRLSQREHIRFSGEEPRLEDKHLQVPEREGPVPKELMAISPGLFEATRHFDPRFKNPCYWAGPALKCLPYFNILGVPKAGTTDLYEKLTGFKQQNPQLVTGEASTETFSAVIGGYWRNLSDPELSLLPSVMKLAIPRSKPIVTLRNPTDRLYSAYWFFGCHTKFIMPWDRVRSTDASISAETFHEYALAGVAQMQECLDGGLSLKSCCRLARTTNFHLATGIYVAAARDWLRIYALHEILFVSFEEYRRDEVGVLLDILHFLELDPPSDKELQAVLDITPQNTRGHHNQPRVEGCSGAAPPMLPETRALLEEFYHPFNLELGELLGDSAPSWARD